MADLEQIPGELNLSFNGGDDFVFTATFAGDYTSSTHVAYVYNGNKLVATFSIIDTYSAPNTVVEFTLTDTQTLAAIPNDLSWHYIMTTSGVSRTLLAGTVKVIKR